jgi:8-hydroxy-5-deazaflavin:NADPH oxidoreductase
MNRVVTVLSMTALAFMSAELAAAEKETIAVIGTGDMGDSLGPRLAALGYRVVYGTRDPASERVAALVAQTGHGATARTQEEAAQAGDIVFTVVPWPAMEEVAQGLGNLAGKIVVDVSMPFAQGPDGYPQSMVETSSAEMIQRWNPGAKVVKAFAAQGSNIIDDPLAAGGPVTVPIASNDRDAKQRVAAIAAAMGLEPVDVGPLRMAREIEALQMIYMIPLVQHRQTSWEFYFRRSHHWACLPQAEVSVKVFDAENLAEMPGPPDSIEPCP